MNHENLNAFVGLCLDPGKVCLLTKFCTRGSLQVYYRATLCGFLCLSLCLSVCLSVRPSVTFVYCIQTAEDIVKLLSRPSILIIPNASVFNSKGNGSVKYTGVGKFCCTSCQSSASACYYCSHLPLSYIIDQYKLQFCRKVLLHSNIVLRTSMSQPAM